MAALTESVRSFVRYTASSLDQDDWERFITFGKESLERDPDFLMELLLKRAAVSGEAHPDVVMKIMRNLGFGFKITTPDPRIDE